MICLPRLRMLRFSRFIGEDNGKTFVIFTLVLLILLQIPAPAPAPALLLALALALAPDLALPLPLPPPPNLALAPNSPVLLFPVERRAGAKNFDFSDFYGLSRPESCLHLVVVA